jgi:hypothetical protein
MGVVHTGVVVRAAEKAYVHESTYHGCSESVLAALQQGLSVGNRESSKAASALAVGIARMGGTCGAPLGGRIGISLAFGREALEESTTSQGYALAMNPSMESCQRFEDAIWQRTLPPTP